MSENYYDSSTVQVRCGRAEGRMHLNLFICPGIHQNCIEVNGTLISPKQFTILGDKEKQKDWKASIRIGGSCLRTQMETSKIVFFDHSRLCGGKCQSRNYLHNTYSPKEESPVTKRWSSDSEQKNPNLKTGYREADYYNYNKNVGIMGRVKSEVCYGEEKRGRGRPRGTNNHHLKRESYKIDSKPHHIQIPAYVYADDDEDQEVEDEKSVPQGCTPFSEIAQCLELDPHHFWSQMHSAGLIAHFCDDIIASVINMKQVVLRSGPISGKMAEMMSRTVFALNAQQTVMRRVRLSESNFASEMCKFWEVDGEEIIEQKSVQTNEDPEARALFDSFFEV